MLSRNRAKFIISLQKKKVREEKKLYLIEGDKLVREFLAAGVPLHLLVAKKEFIGSLSPTLMELVNEAEDVTYEELRQVSTLKTPHNALAIVNMPERNMEPEKLLDDISVALEFIQDPGNLGTIIRTASWFGIVNIVCSTDCVDVYNPKVIQSTMGAILHVNVYYSDLRSLVRLAAEKNLPVYGTLLDGEPIYTQKLSRKGIILIGNESKGISDDLKQFITHRITIPTAGTARPGMDSLNAGMAAAAVFSEFLRQTGGFGNK
jgi:TrmH family RNA methyltransferase